MMLYAILFYFCIFGVLNKKTSLRICRLTNGNLWLFCQDKWLNYLFNSCKVTNLTLILMWFCVLEHRNGIQQRRNSYQDGVYGTNCPIPPGQNFTYKLQVKDQIGSFFYFPSIGFQKAAGGYGAIKILSRPRIPVPFPDPADDYSILIGDAYSTNHTVYKLITIYITFNQRQE